MVNLMQSRFITAGNLKDELEVVLAYELKEAEFRLDLYVIPKKSLNKEAMEKLTTEWVNGGEFAFPEDTQIIYPDINADSILPDNIKSDKTGEIRHKQNEWAVQLLTNKLWESYLIELENLKKRSAALVSYDKSLFEDAKSYWERVLEHKKERNITQERLDRIKEDVNAIFEQLKSFRKTESAEFEKSSTAVREQIVERLNQIKAKADEKANFKTLHDEIKALQHEFGRQRFLKSDENGVRKAYDDAFHYISEQRNKYFTDKYESRITGLKDVISKMEKGLDRDKKDLDYFSKKAESPRIQSLELQLLKVRLRQIKETITSKEDKLKDIQKTLDSILKQANKSTKSEKSVKEGDTTKSEDKPSDAAPVSETDIQTEGEQSTETPSENPEPKGSGEE
jgi:myosin heavy subunit